MMLNAASFFSFYWNADKLSGDRLLRLLKKGQTNYSLCSSATAQHGHQRKRKSGG